MYNNRVAVHTSGTSDMSHRNHLKTAIVTGGTKGIGLGVVRMLVGKGYRVILSYGHDEEAAVRVKAELGDAVLAFQVDHTDRKDTYRFVEYIKEQTDEVNCIVCNVGITRRSAFEDMKDGDWDDMMEVGLTTHVILLRELFDITASSSRIIFTGSALGIYPHATVLGYGVVKSAIHGLVKNLVKVYEVKQTTVNGIAPGFVETEWQKNKPEEIRNNICRKTAIHRFASVEEIAPAYEFCLDNAFVNGSIIEVNGGYSYM